ncbi:hypothetical protein KO481_16905 [Nocardia sp. NEAU-G5]|uniref:Uncharacterized protein n=1 Tax=Nocardia albiluteola TaxID=2842303 RepID=A0ABS6AYS3_9NOCA|nr:hypothetical protein [Nocardia albiluteola]MBU3063201.1 hypothetical protein [Nocardia albiluteola]
MYEGSYWTTEAGLRLKDVYRSVSTLRLSLEQNPMTKGTKGKARKQELRDLMFRDAALWHRFDKRYGGRWPRPRADLALGIAMRTTLRDPARIDKYCKWLLDELGGHQGDPIVYTDDRQVKMLFARLDRNADEPSIWVTAQTVAQVQEGLRRVGCLDRRWTIGEANWELERHSDLDEDYDEGVSPDFLRAAGVDADAISEYALRDHVRRRLGYQLTFLALTDQLSSAVVFTHADKRFRARVGLPTTNETLHRLLDYGLAVDLGPIPARSGESSAFKHRTAIALTQLLTRRPGMIPLLASIGVTVFYLETRAGKDLDNIFGDLEVLPILLDTVRPPVRPLADYSPIEDLRAWQGHDRDKSPAAVGDIAFIEAVALKGAADERLSPGTVIVALSHGQRLEGWWENALQFLDEHNREAE